MAQTTVDSALVVYTVAGNQRPDDPVTITYADETGALRTVENASLPWRLTVVPTVPVNYVTASSNGSQLNCWITDAGGATVAAQTDNMISATCNR
nr:MULTISPECIES: MmpS family transport accessory protein [unclassified Mycolicibacterium]